MEELTNTEKTVLAHLALHQRILSNEAAVKKIFGGDEAARKKTLTDMRDRGLIKHYKYIRHDLQYIALSPQSKSLAAQLVRDARQGSWTPENISLGE